MADNSVENAVAKQVLEKMDTVEISKDLLASIIDKTTTAKAPQGWNLDAPMTMDEMMKAAELVSRTEFCPKDYRGKPENVMVAALYGRDLGLKFLQSLWCIAVINGRPSVWGDGALAVVLASGQVEDFQEFCGSDALAAEGGFCKIKRKGRATPIIVKFTRADAEIAGLWGKSGPWQNYPGRMLQMRARGFALRDGFADILKGMVFVEETSDYTEGLLGPNTQAALAETARLRAPESRSAAPVEATPAAPLPAPPKPMPNTGTAKPQPTAPGGKQLANPFRGKLKAVETHQYEREVADPEDKTGKKKKKAKQNWYRVVALNGAEEVGFATYSDSEADLARTCVAKGTEVLVAWDHTGKPNLRIKSLQPVLPGDDKAAAPKAEEKPQDDGPGFDPSAEREAGMEG